MRVKDSISARKKYKAWQPPPPSFIKFYFDSASQGNPGIARAGMTPCKEDGSFMEGASLLLGIKFNNGVEWEGVVAGIKLASSSGVQNLVLGDFLIIINPLKKGSCSTWNKILQIC